MTIAVHTFARERLSIEQREREGEARGVGASPTRKQGFRGIDRMGARCDEEGATSVRAAESVRRLVSEISPHGPPQT